MMRILSKADVFNSIERARSLTEEQASTFLSKFCQDQPAIGQMLLAGFPMAIESQSKQMCQVFMDTCFDIIYVYTRVLGELPANVVTSQWLHQKMTAMEGDIKAQTQVNENGQVDLKNQAQIELLEYIGLVIHDTAGKSNAQQVAGGITYNLLFMVTRLLDSIYDELMPDTVH
ncbi:hypothetical protein BCS42_04015 [Crenothrix sp. D3]|nr:hypothetical protein BCS42_04015 [Crenothrix sp. D3]